MRRATGGRNSAKGFTLGELLALMAILMVLSLLAIPAYNDYAEKAKFGEVIVASSPTKAAIDTCATGGDCIVNGAINLGLSGQALNGAALAWAYQMAYGYAFLGYGQESPYEAALQAQSAANQEATWGNPVQPAPFNPPGYYCLTQSGLCAQPAFPTAQLMQYMGLYSGPGGGMQTLPCVGTSGSCTAPTKYTASVSYDIFGNITATATTNGGLGSETYVLLPQYSGGHVDWIVSGSCQTRAGGPIC
jgi:type II secretory pathway pseudopilin PulG